MGYFQSLKWAILPSLIYLKKDLPMPHIMLFDTFGILSLIYLKANYLAFNMYLDKQYRLYTDCAIK